MNRLIASAYNVTSQWGEDGIIEEIFNRIGDGSKTCVEFGAYDGHFCSNTWNLWFTKGWKALLIEGDAHKAAALKKYVASRPGATAVHSYVESSGVHTIDAIIERHWKGVEIDLMSIDIDGDDYYILESIQVHKPRVIVIEHNPTIPPHIDLVQKKGEYFGASAKALTRMAETKGYTLIEMSGTNCFFIRNDLYSKIYATEYSIDQLFPHEFLTYVISGYGGFSFLNRFPAYRAHKKKLHQPLLDTELQLVPVGNITPVKRHSLPIRLRKKAGIIYRGLRRRLFRGHPASQDYKVRTIRQFAARFGISTFIETGTYLGGTIDDLKMNFSKLYTIELNQKLFEAAVIKFQRLPHITLLQGDSGIRIDELMKHIDESCLFWLDGHYSGGITSKGTLETPIMKELDVILAHPKKHVMIIDDARLFVGTHDYPTLAQVRARLAGTTYEMKVENDLIRIYPHA